MALKLTLSTGRAAFTTLAVAWLGLATAGCAERAVGPDSETSATGSWIAASAGTYGSCALSSTGAAHCWGFVVRSNCPATGCAVDSLPKRLGGAPISFTSLSSGGFHCGVSTTREAYCWGEIYAGSLGDGVTMRSVVPVRVAIPAPVREVTAGYLHACALTDAGAAYCWGDALGGRLGIEGAGRESVLPQRVNTQLAFSTISAGTTQTCAIASDGDAYCWGGGYGTLGVGARDTSCAFAESCLSSATPLRVEGGLRWTSVSAGNAFTCGVTIDRRGYCWGAVMLREDPNPPLGVLGNATFEGSKVPVLVSGDHSFQMIASGTRQACGLTTEGAAFCWGNNTSAELGIGSVGGRMATPQRVVGNHRFSALTLSDHSCGLAVDSTLYCWGPTRNGRMGNGRLSDGVQVTPTAVLAPLE